MASVLIVDDSQMLVDIVTDILRREGYETSHALSGEQAVVQLRRKKFDVVVTDHYMPGMTGAELTRYIKTSPALQGIPVIGLAGSPEAEKRMNEEKVDVYLRKPVHDEDLVGAVKSVLGT